MSDTPQAEPEGQGQGSCDAMGRAWQTLQASAGVRAPEVSRRRRRKGSAL